MEAAEAIINAIKRPGSDDIYTKLQFLIQKPVIHIDPINDKHIGDKFTITAETNLAVGDVVMFGIYQSPFKSNQKGQNDEFSGASGSVSVVRNQKGMNKLSFNIDTSTFKPDAYLVTVTAILIPDAQGTAFFRLE